MLKNSVKEYRKKNNLTRNKLAVMTGISTEYLARIEREQCEPSVRIALKLCQVFGKTVNEMFYEV